MGGWAAQNEWPIFMTLKASEISEIRDLDLEITDSPWLSVSSSRGIHGIFS